jgi:hypothetical protein
VKLEIINIIESKRAYHRNLAQRPIAEKLAMLDALRERTLTIRQAAARRDSSVTRDLPVEPKRL